MNKRTRIIFLVLSCFVSGCVMFGDGIEDLRFKSLAAEIDVVSWRASCGDYNGEIEQMHFGGLNEEQIERLRKILDDASRNVKAKVDMDSWDNELVDRYREIVGGVADKSMQPFRNCYPPSNLKDVSDNTKACIAKLQKASSKFRSKGCPPSAAFARRARLRKDTEDREKAQIQKQLEDAEQQKQILDAKRSALEREKYLALVKSKYHEALATNPTHLIFIRILYPPKKGDACDEQVDGTWICQAAFVCNTSISRLPPQSEFDLLRFEENGECKSGGMSKNFLIKPSQDIGFSFSLSGRMRPMLGVPQESTRQVSFYLDMIPVRHLGTTNLQNEYGAKVPAAHFVELTRSGKSPK